MPPVMAGVDGDTVVRAPGPKTMHAGVYVRQGKYPPEVVTDNALTWLDAADSGNIRVCIKGNTEMIF